MNTNAQEAQTLISGVLEAVGSTTVDVAVCPPFVNLGVVSQAIGDSDAVALGAQNMHAADAGAHSR